jgi:hypothetical protein
MFVSDGHECAGEDTFALLVAVHREGVVRVLINASAVAVWCHPTQV